MYLNVRWLFSMAAPPFVKSGIYTAPYAAYVYNPAVPINIENGTFTGVVCADATTDTTAAINIKMALSMAKLEGRRPAARPSPSPAARQL